MILKPSQITAVIDTREQLTLDLAATLATKTGTLVTEDYFGGAGLENHVAIKRQEPARSAGLLWVVTATDSNKTGRCNDYWLIPCGPWSLNPPGRRSKLANGGRKTDTQPCRWLAGGLDDLGAAGGAGW